MLDKDSNSENRFRATVMRSRESLVLAVLTVVLYFAASWDQNVKFTIHSFDEAYLMTAALSIFNIGNTEIAFDILDRFILFASGYLRLVMQDLSVLIHWALGLPITERVFYIPFAIIGAATPALIFVLARKMFGGATAWCTWFLIAAMPVHFTLSRTNAAYSTIAAFLFYLLVYCAVRYAESGHRSWGWKTGLVFGLCLCADGQYLLYLPILFLVFYLFQSDSNKEPQGKSGGRKGGRLRIILRVAGSLTVLTCAAVVVVLPSILFKKFPHMDPVQLLNIRKFGAFCILVGAVFVCMSLLRGNSWRKCYGFFHYMTRKEILLPVLIFVLPQLFFIAWGLASFIITGEGYGPFRGLLGRAFAKNTSFGFFGSAFLKGLISNCTAAPLLAFLPGLVLFLKKCGKMNKNALLILFILVVLSFPWIFMVPGDVTISDDFIHHVDIAIAIIAGCFFGYLIEAGFGGKPRKHFAFGSVLLFASVIAYMCFFAPHSYFGHGPGMVNIPYGGVPDNTGAKSAGYFLREKYPYETAVFTARFFPRYMNYYSGKPNVWGWNLYTPSDKIWDEKLFKIFKEASENTNVEVVVLSRDWFGHEDFFRARGYSEAAIISHGGVIKAKVYDKSGDEPVLLEVEKTDAAFDEKYGNPFSLAEWNKKDVGLGGF